MARTFKKDLQYYKFCFYGFLKNLRFFDPFIILFFLEKGLTYFQIGSLYAIKEVTINILEIPTGVVADALGRRRTMIASFLSYIFSFLIFFFARTYLLFIPAMLLFAFGEAFRTGTHKAMIFEYLNLKGWRDQKAYYYGHTRSWSQLGSALSAIIAAVIIFWRGNYSAVFLFSTIPYILDLLLMISYPKVLDGTRNTMDKQKLGETIRLVLKEVFASIKEIALLKAIGNVSLHSGYYKAVKDYLQPLVKTFALSLPIALALTDHQRTAVLVGVVYALIYLLTSVSARKSGVIAHRFRNLAIPLNLSLFLGLLAGGISGTLFVFGIPSLAVVFYIGIYIMENFRKPIGIAWISEELKEDILATALSVQSQTATIVTAGVALLIGALADHFGIGYGLLIVSGILFIPSLLLRVKVKD